MKMLTTEDGAGHARPPRELLESLFRHKKKAVLFFATVVLTALAVLAFASGEYTSTAKLIVRGGRESIFLDPTTANGESRTLYKEWKNVINSELEIIGSRELMNDVILSLGADFVLSKPLPPTSGRLGLIRATLNPVRMAIQEYSTALKSYFAGSAQDEKKDSADKAIELIEKNLTIDDRDSSDIILISYAANSPEKAQAIVSCLMDTYLEKRIDILQIPGAYEFFNQQTDLLLEELTQTEESIASLKSASGINSPDDFSALEKALESIRSQHLTVKSSLAASDARIAMLQSQLKQPAQVGKTQIKQTSMAMSEVGVSISLKDLIELISKSAREMAPTESTTELARIQIASMPAEQPIASAKTLTLPVEPIKPRLNLDPEEYKVLQTALHAEEGIRSALQAEALEIGQQLATLQNDLVEMNKLAPSIRGLQREQSLLEEKYRKFSVNKEQARINQELEMKRISNVSIVQRATLPGRANPSGKLFKLFAAMFLGLGGSIALAFGASAVDPSLYSAFDISERLGLVTLAELPHMPRNELDPSSSIFRSKPGLYARIFRSNDPHPGAFDDYFTDLYYKILALRNPEQSGPFVIGITSNTIGEGVTTIATYLTAAFAHDGSFSSVLLLDANPETHSNRLVKKMNGIPFTYQHIKDIRNTDDSEAIPIYAVACIKELSIVRKWEYEIIVVDIPAVLDEDYAIRLAAAVDLAILTIDSGRIPWRTAHRSTELLTNAQAKLAGVILNRKHVATPKWLYRKL